MSIKIKGIGNISDNKIEGIATIDGGSYENLSIDGVCTINGDIETNRFDVDGTTTCEGNIVCKEMDCDGVVTIHGNVRSETIVIDGVVTVNGSKVEANRIECDGVLSVQGQISADVIISDGFIKAQEIVGDEITIMSKRISAFFKLFTPKRFKYSHVKLIEATTVMLRYVQADTVSGQNVNIGPGCEIRRVDCSGELTVDPSATIEEVVQN